MLLYAKIEHKSMRFFIFRRNKWKNFMKIKQKILLSMTMFLLVGCSEKLETAVEELSVPIDSFVKDSEITSDSIESTSQSTGGETMSYSSGSLIKAVEENNLTLVKEILQDKNYDKDERNNQGESALLIATHENQIKIAQALITVGADVNLQDHIQDSPYLYAATQGKTEILKFMMENSTPDQTVFNRFGGNGLIPAAEKGHLDNVRLLLADDSVDIDHQNNYGYTALIEAVALRDGSEIYQEILQELVNHGANQTLRDNYGKTAEDYAKELGYQKMLEILQSN